MFKFEIAKLPPIHKNSLLSSNFQNYFTLIGQITPNPLGQITPKPIGQITQLRITKMQKIQKYSIFLKK